MKASDKGALIGGGIGLYTGITGPDYSILAIGLMAIIIGFFGWCIGRYIDLRKG